MKQITELIKYVIVPNVRFYGGFIYEGEDMFLCDDKDKGKDFFIRVKQTIEKDILKTDIIKKYKMSNGKKVKEKSHLEIEIDKGQKLIYVEGIGYTIPEYKMVEIDEAISHYNLLKGE